MKGIYLGSEDGRLQSCDELYKNYRAKVGFTLGKRNGTLVYNPREWTEIPIVKFPGFTLVVSGWFIFKGQLNAVHALADSLLSQGEAALTHIDMGAFLLLWQHGDEVKFVTDRFGLHPHFIDKASTSLRLAPSVKALFTESHPQDPLLAEVLAKRQHLFGNFTLYKGIERLEPGAVTTIQHIDELVASNTGVKFYHQFDAAQVPIEDLHTLVGKIASCWPKSERLAPISAGLDSRFLLAHAEFGNGFTYGPEGAPERNVGESFSHLYENYLGYDYLTPTSTDLMTSAAEEICFGQMEPVKRLIGNYLYIASQFENAKVFFDGYLGDTLQRGTYINFKGPLGEFFKLFPWIYRLGFSAAWLLRKRYANLSEAAFELLLADFSARTRDLPLDDYQKLTWYEFIYGRGSRYIVGGSNLMVSQLFTSVCFFTHNQVFDSLITQDFTKAVSYRLLKPLWQRAPDKFRQTATESGYSPSTPPMFIPVTQLLYRLAFHLMPGRANYGVALKRQAKQKGAKN
ncbi:hypothetical protein [Shewanella sp. FJAT-52076]|uniref:hypothetical protein n=1 Tax=Shewanella sp. FJAT-52076 TaxID=2864202 RepID=UPI001C6610A1|nr:hypothetical protein [Shewanella sp. FJAT-52076]QYJ74034.1 hypothetical protein K0H79_11665 [Shewanella sp. FJAT-52076]